MINEISLGSTLKKLIVTLVLYTNGGNALTSFIGVHYNAKQSLKKSGLLQA